ncbi:AMP-binding protein [Albimonas sp. CAU 1670]|uniref:class I adenylate-forming enzyme family protein n=1 Tax=Albimonas sp. CAU 1670 TaxID=3032599 RepID=UPI0023DB79D9|nr:AMP-binding protein [Albimonas sp. CAU 1670]MDF2233663.1 AMP-binding protein [Albimonas sp. CAU 1670]
MNIALWLHQTAARRPEAPAVRVGEALHATYGDYAARTRALARGFAARGVGPGDRVVLFAKNGPDYLAVMHAALWIGAAIVPVNHKLHPAEAAWIVADAGARLAVTETGDLSTRPDWPADCLEVGLHSGDFAEAATPGPGDRTTPPREAREDDLAWLFYTSGTTGRPKGVMLTHGALRAMAMTYPLDVDPARASDHPLYAAPMSHGAGLYTFHYIRLGACHVIPPGQGFDPAEIEALARALGDLVFFAAPTMIRRLVAHARASGWRGEGVRTVIYGGGPMYLADLDEAVDLMGPRFVQIYGQGESPMTITVLPRDMVADRAHPRAEARRGSVGYAQACVEVRVVDEAMADVPVDAPGEIVVRGATVMKGYWNRPEATAETLVDGWLRTGDVGRLDADGFLTLTDRSKDVIISGGTNIYPREVEETLLAHAGVAEVSVIGVPSAEWGEDVLAFVVLHPGADCGPETLDAWCRARMASFKKPKHWRFLDELPKNAYGKVLKTELRKQA